VHAHLLPRPLWSWSLLLHRKSITSFTAVLLPFVTSLLTLPNNYWSGMRKRTLTVTNNQLGLYMCDLFKVALKFITVFTKARNSTQSWATWSPHYHAVILTPILLFSAHQRLGLSTRLFPSVIPSSTHVLYMSCLPHFPRSLHRYSWWKTQNVRKLLINFLSCGASAFDKIHALILGGINS
jgi:hypothetical protein